MQPSAKAPARPSRTSANGARLLFTGRRIQGPGVAREVQAVRNRVGVMDASTLGKIDIKGPDASVLLDLGLHQRLGPLGVGRCRYGMMCREDGMVFDDGVTSGGSPTSISTSQRPRAMPSASLPGSRNGCRPNGPPGARADRGDGGLRHHRRPGPGARQVARSSRASTWRLAAFPHMRVAPSRIGGVPARLFRVSYTGELGYEVNVPARTGARSGRRCTGVAGPTASRLRHRGDARAAGREGLHHGRPGDRRHGDARRSRPRGRVRKAKADFVGKRSR